MSAEKVIQQGAEAVLIKAENVLIKRRIAKGYRLKELDEKLRKLRTRGEARLLERAGKIISVPKVLKVDESTKEIEMEFIEGKKLSDHLDSLKNWKEVCEKIGENIARLHDAGIIHGDLTTSNMIYADVSRNNFDGAQIGRATSSMRHRVENGSVVNRTTVSARSFSRSLNHNGLADARRGDRRNLKSDGRLYFIDFGLSFMNGRVEDKAVDLHLIRQALEAKHFERWEKFWKGILAGYRKTSKNAAEVLKRLEKVEKRGRYKSQY